MSMVYCSGCGSEIHSSAKNCPSCGAVQPGIEGGNSEASPKKRLVALVLNFLLGILGVHRFYVGKVGTGILQFFTLGGLFIWSFIDFILILCGTFKDIDGKRLTNW
jgi:hypothetical protein